RSKFRTASRTASSLCKGAAASSDIRVRSSGGEEFSISGRGNSVTNARRSRRGCGSTENGVAIGCRLWHFRMAFARLEAPFQAQVPLPDGGSLDATHVSSAASVDVLIDENWVPVRIDQSQASRPGGRFVRFGSEGQPAGFETSLNCPLSSNSLSGSEPG